MTDGQTLRPIDRTPGIPGSDKKLRSIAFQRCILRGVFIWSKSVKARIQKSASKIAFFFRDPKLDQVTLEGAGTWDPKFLTLFTCSLKSFFLAFRQITRDFDVATHIQGTTMWKLTSWGFQKCIRSIKGLRGYGCSRSEDCEILCPLPKLRGVFF